MFSWHSHTIIRLLVPFAIGTAAALTTFFQQWDVAAISFVALLSILLVFQFLWKGEFNPRRRWLFSALLFLLVANTAVLNVAVRWDELKSHHFSSQEKAEYYIIELTETPTQSPNSIKSQANVIGRIDENDERKQCAGTSLIYFEKNHAAARLKYGDLVLVRADFRRLEPPKNPNQFDYSKVQANQNQFYQTYIAAEKWMSLPSLEGRNSKAFFQGVQQYLIQNLTNYLPNENAVAVASALLLGNKSRLNDEIAATYKETGATHVLAVSGLHVGILTLILVFLFSFLKNRRPFGRYLFAALIISCLWGYAALTGFSPSVSRAVLMFSILMLGNIVLRPQSIYNSLGLAAMLLLIFNPFWLLQLGFLLSFLAVVGIVFFVPKIEGLIHFNNKIIKSLWSWTAVSIAAQIATLPIILYFFQQYPVYSLLSNPVAMFGAMIILPVGLLFSGVSFLHYYFNCWWLETALIAIGMALSKFIEGMNFLLERIQQLPFAVIKNMQFSTIDFVLTFCLILSLIFLIQTRRKQFIYIGLLAMLLMAGFSSWNKIEQTKEARFTVYEHPRKSIFEFQKAGKAYIFTDAETPKVTYSISGNHQVNGIIEPLFLAEQSDTTTDFFSKQENYMQFAGKAIGQITPENELFMTEMATSFFDIIILSHSPNFDLEQKADDWKGKKIIIDSSNKAFLEKKYAQICRESELDCHFISSAGAFQLFY